MWQLFFILFFTVSGIVAPARAGFKEKGFWRMFFFVFENSLGNINDPDDATFNDKSPQAYYKYYFIWFIWWAN